MMYKILSEWNLSKDNRIEIYKINKISWSCFDDNMHMTDQLLLIRINCITLKKELNEELMLIAQHPKGR